MPVLTWLLTHPSNMSSKQPRGTAVILQHLIDIMHTWVYMLHKVRMKMDGKMEHCLKHLQCCLPNENKNNLLYLDWPAVIIWQNLKSFFCGCFLSEIQYIQHNQLTLFICAQILHFIRVLFTITMDPKMVLEFKLGHFVHVKMIFWVNKIVVPPLGAPGSRRVLKWDILEN